MANYLYNGVKLPDINEVWIQKDKYPFGVIYYDASSSLFVFTALNHSVPYHSERQENGYLGLYSGMLWQYFALAGGSWDLGYEPVSPSGMTFLDLDDGDYLVWSSFDIPFASDNSKIYFSASDPVPVIQLNPAALMQGYMVGQAIRRARGQKVEPPEEEKTPIAYLYNGMGPLPDINAVWIDKENYPYAFIVHNRYNYILHISTAEVKVLTNVEQLSHTTWGGNCIKYVFEETENAWIYRAEGASSESIPFVNVWANHDILRDGTLYLAASEPVPVYE